jgi:hypothetical protein
VRVIAALIEGLRYVRNEPMVRWLMLLFAATTLFARPYVDLLPAFARSISVDAVGLSQMAACVGLGSLFAGFITASSGRVRRKGVAVIGCVVATGFALVFFAVQTTLVPSLALIVTLSFFLMTASGIVGALIQFETPDHLARPRGRRAEPPHRGRPSRGHARARLARHGVRHRPRARGRRSAARRDGPGRRDPSCPRCAAPTKCETPRMRDDLTTLGIAETAALFRSRRISPRELVGRAPRARRPSTQT